MVAINGYFVVSSLYNSFRVVTKGRGPGISPGYSEHGPRLLVVKLNQKGTPLKHTKTIHQTKC